MVGLDGSATEEREVQQPAGVYYERPLKFFDRYSLLVSALTYDKRDGHTLVTVSQSNECFYEVKSSVNISRQWPHDCPAAASLSSAEGTGYGHRVALLCSPTLKAFGRPQRPESRLPNQTAI